MNDRAIVYRRKYGIPHEWGTAVNVQTMVFGNMEIFQQLEDWLAEITGFAAVSLQPNAGSQGEFAGLLAIREYHGHYTNGEIACDAAANLEKADG